MHADEGKDQHIFYGKASTWLAQLEAGEQAWDPGIVWMHEGKWRAVLDHLQAEQKLNLLARYQDGGELTFKPTNDPQNAWIAESDLRQIFASPPSEVMAQIERRRQEAETREARRQEAKKAAGRYTLQEAADALATNAGGQAKRWLGKLMGAAEAETLTVYPPGENDKYRPKTVRPFWEEAYGSDLNAWLDANEDRTDWRFPPAYSPEFIKLRHDQAEAVLLRWRQEHAARRFSAAVNFPHAPEDVTLIEYDTRADFLAAHGPGWDKPATPGWWAYLLAAETAEHQGWPENDLKGIGMTWRARENNLRTLSAGVTTLRLLQWPNYEPRPAGAPLPDNWQDGLFVRKADLREWAKVNAPHWLTSAALAVPGDETLCGEDVADFQKGQEAEWNGGSIDWDRWTVKSVTLTAAQAARLMAGLDPEKFESLTFTKADKAGPAKAQAKRLEQLAAADEPPKERDTPAGWLAWSDGKRERVHSSYRVAIQHAASAKAEAPEGEAIKESAQLNGLKTGDLARAFSSIFTMSGFIACRKGLSDPRHGISRGSTGGGRGRGNQRIHNPVSVATYLREHSAPIDKLNKAFQEEPSLEPWRAEWTRKTSAWNFDYIRG